MKTEGAEEQEQDRAGGFEVRPERQIGPSNILDQLLHPSPNIEYRPPFYSHFWPVFIGPFLAAYIACKSPFPSLFPTTIIPPAFNVHAPTQLALLLFIYIRNLIAYGCANAPK